MPAAFQYPYVEMWGNVWKLLISLCIIAIVIVVIAIEIRRNRSEEETEVQQEQDNAATQSDEKKTVRKPLDGIILSIPTSRAKPVFRARSPHITSAIY